MILMSGVIRVKDWLYRVSFRIATYFGAPGVPHPAVKPGEDFGTWAAPYFSGVAWLLLVRLADWLPSSARLFGGVFFLAMCALSVREIARLTHWRNLPHDFRARGLFCLSWFVFCGFQGAIKLFVLRSGSPWSLAVIALMSPLFLGGLVCSMQAVRAKRSSLVSHDADVRG
jgi:hypothetical protein